VAPARSAIPSSHVNLTMEAGSSSETFAPVFLSTRYHIPENQNLRCANHKAGQFCKQPETRRHTPQHSKNNGPSQEGYSVPRNDLYSTIPYFSSHCLNLIIHMNTQRKQLRHSTATAVKNTNARSVLPTNFAPRQEATLTTTQ